MRTTPRLMVASNASPRARRLAFFLGLVATALVARGVASVQGQDVAARDSSNERLASRTNPIDGVAIDGTHAPRATTPSFPEPSSLSGEVDDPVATAKQFIAACQVRYASIRDYTCTFVKRERVNGELMPQNIMHMKARTQPRSFYFKFQTPNKGREAIWVAGRHKDKVVAHDVGFGKLLAGTMYLDPRGTMAMEGCRHPITEAGIGALIDEVAKHWAVELTLGESELKFHPGMHIGPRACTMIESTHPTRQPHFKFYKVKLYVDHEHGLPIRVEAYDWPRHPGAAGELQEEYTYVDLRVNVGLTDSDFDPNNRSYSYGRF